MTYLEQCLGLLDRKVDALWHVELGFAPLLFRFLEFAGLLLFPLPLFLLSHFLLFRLLRKLCGRLFLPFFLFPLIRVH